MKFGRKSAIVCVILIVLLYASSIIFALMDSPYAQGLLLTSLFLTVVIPAFLYGVSMLLKLNRKNIEEEFRRDSGMEEETRDSSSDDS